MLFDKSSLKYLALGAAAAAWLAPKVQAQEQVLVIYPEDTTINGVVDYGIGESEQRNIVTDRLSFSRPVFVSPNGTEFVESPINSFEGGNSVFARGEVNKSLDDPDYIPLLAGSRHCHGINALESFSGVSTSLEIAGEWKFYWSIVYYYGSKGYEYEGGDDGQQEVACISAPFESELVKTVEGTFVISEGEPTDENHTFDSGSASAVNLQSQPTGAKFEDDLDFGPSETTSTTRSTTTTSSSSAPEATGGSVRNGAITGLATLAMAFSWISAIL